MFFTLAAASALILFTPRSPVSPDPVIAPTSPGCVTMFTDRLPLEKRKSPLDSIAFTVAGDVVKVCYGRPSLRGRAMLGSSHVPYGKVWRTGANEPTMLHTSGPITVAGIAVPAGTYSLYSVPGEREWQIIVNRATSQWGEESGYPEVEKQELGRGKATSERLAKPVETFTISAAPAEGDASALVLEWERTRVRIPLSAGRKT